MKRLENIFRIIFIAITGFYLSLTTQAQTDVKIEMDSVEIGLITCSPHDEVYSLYGHTAIRYHDLRSGADWVFNYGIFNFKAPHFVTRFVFGLTDYELGIAPTMPFLEYYAQWGSGVTEQVLNLTSEDKEQITLALQVNYMPENRVYRYNFFYDNCSTRPRDIIEQNINGKIVYTPRADYTPTYREMVHAHTKGHPWTTFGNDLLLGIKSDFKTDMRQQEFLPDNLRFDFDHAFIEREGRQEPLVKERRQLVPPGVQMTEQEFPLSPTLCGIILLIISLFVLTYEYVKKTTTRYFDILLMLLTGLAGVVLFVMIFSEHPTTSINLQILILNPLALFFIWPVWKRRKTRWFAISMVLTILFLIGSFWQDYAEGMEFLALCLLLRCLRHLVKGKKKKVKK